MGDWSQVLHWERKLQMEKDMHAALNTRVRTEQLAALQRNIQRLSLQHSELLQEQESIIVLMELSIEKRDNISMKVRNMDTPTHCFSRERGAMDLSTCYVTACAGVQNPENFASSSASSFYTCTVQQTFLWVMNRPKGYSFICRLKG